MRKFVLAAGLVAAITAAPAFAQDPSMEEPVFVGDYLVVGVGGIFMPSYRGSDDYVAIPFPVVQGRFKGVTFRPRAGGVALDFITEAQEAKVGFALGPVVTYSGNRARRIKDDAVRHAGKLNDAVELGVSAGVTAYKVLNPYDQLSFTADVRWDVAGSHNGTTISPSVTYMTPISRAALVTLNVNARHADGDFNRYYYSVNFEQSLASGLPMYRANKGWDSVNVALMGAYDLDANILNGGLSVFAIGMYGKMLNDGKNTPFTRSRGDADQFIGGMGVSYAF